MCARFLSYFVLLYIGRVHGAISGCTVLVEVHPVSAQNKSLISDTGGLIELLYCGLVCKGYTCICSDRLPPKKSGKHVWVTKKPTNKAALGPLLSLENI